MAIGRTDGRAVYILSVLELGRQVFVPWWSFLRDGTGWMGWGLGRDQIRLDADADADAAQIGSNESIQQQQ